MIELRWICPVDRRAPVLQYRQRKLVTDASGAICDGGEWGDWQDVEVYFPHPEAES